MERFGRQPDIWAGEQKKESCGVVAAISKNGRPVADIIYNGMLALQHRGQDAAGMVLWDGKLRCRKGLGLVSSIFSEGDISEEGGLGIAHTRYPTTDTCGIEDVQPTVLEGSKLAVAHNGHIANYSELRKELEAKGIVFSGSVDSEVIMHVLADAFGSGKGIEDAVRHAMERLDGSYSVVAIKDGTLFAFRDPHAIRPLELGEDGDALIVASESVALDVNGARHLGPVKGGELIIFGKEGVERKVLAEKEPRNCMFEYVYFSRPDSQINGIWVHEVRAKLGIALAKEGPVDADVVIPIPDSARTAANAFARELGIRFEEGIIKNRYIARTFIMPDQDTRVKAVRVKLNPVRKIVEGKRVVLVDDSIVRGTTTKEILKIVREAGAKEVHMRVTCPPIRHPCFYGVDMSTYQELIANRKSIDEIRKFIGADSLHYISLEGLKSAIGGGLCTACLDGDYPTKKGAELAKERRGSSGCG